MVQPCATRLQSCKHISHTRSVLQVLLCAAAEDPESVALDLPILTQDDYNLMVLEHNNTSAPFPADKMLHQLFEAHAATQPGATCIRAGDKALTYAEVNLRNQPGQLNCIGPSSRSVDPSSTWEAMPAVCAESAGCKAPLLESEHVRP